VDCDAFIWMLSSSAYQPDAQARERERRFCVVFAELANGHRLQKLSVLADRPRLRVGLVLRRFLPAEVIQNIDAGDDSVEAFFVQDDGHATGVEN
jgi:hypothetical protein